MFIAKEIKKMEKVQKDPATAGDSDMDEAVEDWIHTYDLSLAPLPILHLSVVPLF